MPSRESSTSTIRRSGTQYASIESSVSATNSVRQCGPIGITTASRIRWCSSPNIHSIVGPVGGDAALEPRIVIAGTGRAGTTLLVQILTDLGLPTGFQPDSRINETARAGLERSLDGVAPPRIVKDPGLSKHLGRLLDEGKVAVEHVIVPMRDLDVAAASRVRATKYGTEPSARGGLFGTRSATRQKEGLAL